MGNLRIGTAGWNYPSGAGTWNGIFYPAGVGRRPRAGTPVGSKFDELAYFEFSLKLYRKFTHPDVPGVPRLDDPEIDAFRRGIEPLAGAGKIGALLAQFPPSFKQSPASQAYLDALLARFHDYPVAVELRHRSWSDDFNATLSLLNSRGAALTQIDEPKFKLSIRQNQLPNITSFYYMRLHGRNAAQWWKHAGS